MFMSSCFGKSLHRKRFKPQNISGSGVFPPCSRKRIQLFCPVLSMSSPKLAQPTERISKVLVGREDGKQIYRTVYKYIYIHIYDHMCIYIYMYLLNELCAYR